jgi:hypothetical protein
MASAIVLAVLVVLLVAAQHQQSAGSAHADPGSTGTSTSPVPAATAATSPVRSARADKQQVTTRSAASVLATLPVKGRAPKTGYSRAQFGSAWTDDTSAPGGHNGCDTRNDILRRDLVAVVLKPGSNGCAVASGVLLDPYTGHRIAFVRGARTSAAVQIDHVVALSNAWQSGAQQWARSTRVELANDPLNLLAVDGPANEAKGDANAASWLPPNKAYRCAYVARQVAVKARYRLAVTSSERDAIARVLATCPGQPVPGEAGTVAITHTAAPTTSSRSSAARALTGPGSGCTPGYRPCIAPGPDVDCEGGSGNGPRYVPGPVTVTGDDPYGLDADHDGTGCES